jgi:hypothetical protein
LKLTGIALLRGVLVCSALSAQPEVGWVRIAPVSAQQQYPDFDALASHSTVAIRQFSVGSPESIKVLVLDFEDRHGAPTQLGHELAGQFADSLRKKTQGFIVLNRDELQLAVASRNLPPETMSDAHAIKCYASDLATMLVKGALNYTADGVTVEVIVEAAKQAEVPKLPKSILREEATFPMTAPMKELASKPAPAPSALTFIHEDARIWVNPEHPPLADEQVVNMEKLSGKGYTLPRCVSCANPSFSDKSVDAKFKETVIFRVQILVDGFPAKISLFRGVPCSGLTNLALETVKHWTFKPAERPDGKPVAAEIPVEVTVSLY